MMKRVFLRLKNCVILKLVVGKVESPVAQITLNFVSTSACVLLLQEKLFREKRTENNQWQEAILGGVLECRKNLLRENVEHGGNRKEYTTSGGGGAILPIDGQGGKSEEIWDKKSWREEERVGRR
jgi:hypothetical protein